MCRSHRYAQSIPWIALCAGSNLKNPGLVLKPRFQPELKPLEAAPSVAQLQSSFSVHLSQKRTEPIKVYGFRSQTEPLNVSVDLA